MPPRPCSSRPAGVVEPVGMWARREPCPSFPRAARRNRSRPAPGRRGRAPATRCCRSIRQSVQMDRRVFEPPPEPMVRGGGIDANPAGGPAKGAGSGAISATTTPPSSRCPHRSSCGVTVQSTARAPEVASRLSVKPVAALDVTQTRSSPSAESATE